MAGPGCGSTTAPDPTGFPGGVGARVPRCAPPLGRTGTERAYSPRRRARARPVVRSKKASRPRHCGGSATGGGAGLGVWVDCATQQPFMETAGIPTFTPTANGVYTYVVIDATMSCYGIGNCVQVTNVSLDENDEVLFSIAPNPSNGIFTLKNPSLIDGVIVITDGSGRIIYESSIDVSEKSIDISNASLGIYYLNIKSENNNKVIRLIKN